MLQNIRAVQRLAGVREEILHDLELHLRQLDRHALFHQRPVAQVQREIARADLLLEIVLGAHFLQRDAAVHRIHARDELAGAERLRHIIVRAHHQPAHLIHFLRTRRQQNDADGAALLAQLPADRKAVVGPRHHDIQNGHVERPVFALVQLQGLLAVFRLCHLVARPLQIDDHKLADRLFILRHQYPFHASGSSSFLKIQSCEEISLKLF